jgi:hypothetical protein
MAALTASSWTLTIDKQWIAGGRKHVTGTLQLPGTDTYPDNGIPLPSIDKFGFRSEMYSLNIVGVNQAAGTVADYVTRWDKANHKLFLYEEESVAAGGPLLECDTAEVPGPRTYDFIAIGN